MQVRELMTDHPSACTVNDTANDAARVMWEQDCGSVPIVDTDGRVVGIVTDRDICMAAYFSGQRLGEIPLGSVMSRDVTTCRQEDDLEDVERLMRERQVRRLPVVENGRMLVGILSLGDIAQAVERVRPRQGGSEAFIRTVATISEPRQEQRNGAARL